MKTAPKDGTIVRLLVDYRAEDDALSPLDASLPVPVKEKNK